MILSALYCMTFNLFTSLLIAAGLATAQDGPAGQNVAAEVRQLRVSLEHIAALAAQESSLARRWEFQQRRVDRLEAELRDLDRQVAVIASEQAKADSTIHSVEGRLTGITPDPNSPHFLQLQAEMVAPQAESRRTAVALDRIRAAQSDLGAVIRNENKKLSDLEGKLAAIEAKLASLNAK